jgi:hypothetical protein
MDSYGAAGFGVYTDARTEYSKQLCHTIVPAIFKLFMDMLKKAREDVGGESRKVLFRYQTLLNEIPDWNMDKVYREIGGLVDAINCEYLKELITAVFLAHAKVLMAIRISKSDSNINLTVPAVDHFLFKVLCETGKLYWKSTYLFRDDVSNLDKQQNLRAAEQLVAEGIHAAIRAMIPVKNILKDCITAADKKDDSDDEDDGAMASGVPAAAAATPEPVDSSEESATVTTPMPEPAASAAAPEPDHAESEIAVHDVEDAHSILSVDEATAVPTAESLATPNSNILHIDEEPEVKFAEFDSVFDGEDSNMHYDPKTGELNDGELIIEDGPGEALTDFDELSETGEPVKTEVYEPVDDFEELVG